MINTENFHIDYNEFRNVYGMIEDNDEGKLGHNPLRFNTTYVYAARKWFKLSPDQIFRQQMDYRNHFIVPGLLMRSPAHLDLQEGPDDYVAAGFYADMIDRVYAKEILKYGRSQKWLGLIPKYLYNNVNPGVFTGSAWIGRQQQVIAHLQWAAGETPPMWRRLWWASVILLSAYVAERDDQDGKVLSWMLIKVAYHKGGWLERFVSDRWVKIFRLQYPGGIGQVLKDYFNRGGKVPHPHEKYLWGEYGP